MRTLLAAAADLVVVLDQDAVVLDMLSRLDDSLFRLPPADQIGRPVVDGLTPEQAPQLETFFRRAVNGERVGFTMLVSGQHNPTYLRGHMAPWAHGSSSGVLITGNLVRDGVGVDELRERDFLRNLILSYPEYLLITDADGDVLHANPSALQGLGMEAGRAPVNISALIAPKQRSRLRSEILPAVRATGTWRGECTWQRKTQDGIEQFETSGMWLLQAQRRDEFGEQPARIIVFARDITPRVEAERAIRDSERNMRRMFEQTPVPLLAVDAQGKIAAANLGAAQMLGTPAISLVGESIRRFQDGTSYDSSLQGIRRASERGTRTSWQGLMESATGERFDIDFNAHAVSHVGGARQVLVSCIDVTERNRLQRTLSHQIEHDALTGLLNRAGLRRALRARMRGDRRSDFLFHVNLDYFRYLNQLGGAALGDQVLRDLAELQHSRSSDPDTIIARVGADEFVLVRQAESVAEARAVGSAVLSLIEAYAVPDEAADFWMSASIGIAELVPSRESESLSHAATACERVKRRARGNVEVYSPRDEQPSDVLALIAGAREAREAIAQDRVQLYAQPIYLSQDTARPHAFEMLARIDTHGAVAMPRTLIDGAERFGLMDRLDRHMVGLTLDWLLDNPGIVGGVDHVSINLSGDSVSNENFLDFLINRIEHSGISPAKLCFEITETTAVRNIDQARQMMAALQHMGCRFSLDDFGAGMCSFAYLRDLDVNDVKIDGSFITGVEADPVKRQLVRAINQTAQVLGKTTIAEFVDKAETLAVLQELGVDAVQGWLFSRAVPAAQAPELLAGRPPGNRASQDLA